MPIPKLLITAGLMAANMALSMTRKIEGPRLDDLKFTSGDYGVPLTKVWALRRLQTSIFWAEDLREVKRQRKTKGGKYNEYTYYGTWAVAVAGHEIEAIRRIWFDTHLVYDMTGAGPVTPFDFGEITSGKNSTGVGLGGFSPAANIAIYYGTETQEPDPRIEATTEERNGEGSCPAYRGTAYIVFKDVPLEKLGNRIPQVAVEVASGTAYPTELLTLDYEAAHIRFSNDFSWLAVGAETGVTLLDTAARSAISVQPFTPNLTYNDFGAQSDGSILGVTTSLGGYLYNYPIGGIGEALLDVNSSTAVTVVTDANGVEHWATTNLFDGADFYFDGTAINLDDMTGVSWNPSLLFADADGGVWIVGGKDPGTGSGSAYFYRLYGPVTGPGFIEVTGLDTDSASNGAVHYKDATRDQFVFEWAGKLVLYDRLTDAVTTTLASTSPSTATFAALRPGMTSIWAGLKEVSLADLSVIRTMTIGSWGLVIAPSQVIYDPVNHALVHGSAFTLRWLYLDRVGSSGVLLSEIMEDLAADCDVVDYDFSDLDQTVPGWSATNGQASNMAEPLLDAYDSEIRPHGFTLQGIKRTGVSSGSILTEQFVGEPRYAVKVRQAAELPRALTISFADVDAEQQVANVRCDRPLDATGARSERQLDLQTLAANADDARHLGDRYFRRIWNERREVSLSLTAQHLALEPGDCRTLSLDGESDIYRCVSVTHRADDTLEAEWKYDHPSLAVLDGTAGAGFDGRNPATINVPLISKGFILDVPLLSDSDDDSRPLLYMGAAPYATGAWPGAIIYESIDGEYSLEQARVPPSSPTTWGVTTDILADANPNLWDRSSSVNIRMQYGTLAGTTEAGIDADPTRNLMLIGDELVNFTTATLEGDGTYTLSGFKRGRRGTEWACATHATGETAVLLSAAQAVAQGLSDVSTAMSFKALTVGRSTGFPESLTFSGASLKPYAPCQLEAEASGSDWVLAWVRRTRVGGAWTGGAAIPLSEASEEYEVDIMDGVTVKRTFSALSSPTATYTAAQQTTDFGAPLSSAPTFRVYQISDAVGRGFVAEYA